MNFTFKSNFISKQDVKSTQNILRSSSLLFLCFFEMINTRKPIFFSVLVFLVISGCSSDKFSNLKDLNLQGAVSEYRTTTYGVKEENGIYYPDEKRILDNTDEIHMFNEYGIYTYYGLLNDGELEIKSEFKKISNTQMQVLDSNLISMTATRRIIYIERGLPKVVEFFDEDGKLSQINEFKWKNNTPNEVRHFGANDDLINTIYNEFKNEQLITQTITDSIGRFESQDIFIRNELNDLIEHRFRKKSKDAKSIILSKHSYEYDDNGNWRMSTEYDSIDKVQSITLRTIKYNGEVLPVVNQAFIGTWFEIGGRDWVDFKESNLYDFGNYEDIKHTGGWSFEENTKSLTLRANDPTDSKKFTYDFFGNVLILSTLDGREIMRLLKNPTKQETSALFQ